VETTASYAVLHPSSAVYWVQGDEVIEAARRPVGLMKEVIQEGDGRSYPQTGDIVVAHYTGRLLDGEEFDSSVRRGQPFRFPLGAGRVIRGWDEGFANMTVGEKAFLYIPYNMAYGERGQPPKIPPRATLVFEVELLDIEKRNTRGRGPRGDNKDRREL